MVQAAFCAEIAPENTPNVSYCLWEGDGRPPAPEPQFAEVTTAGQHLAFMDDHLKLYRRRYDWEHIARGVWLTYIVDMQPYFSILERLRKYAGQLYDDNRRRAGF